MSFKNIILNHNTYHKLNLLLIHVIKVSTFGIMS